jgi:hypothetical protein
MTLMNDGNPYESPQVVEAQAQPESVASVYAGDAVPADLKVQDLLMVLGVTGLMILIALAVPYLLAMLFGA